MSAKSAVMTAAQVGADGPYRCPLCKVQTTSDAEDIGWIACPMMREEVICLGCCFDYAGIALSEDFETHPFFDDFRKLSSRTGIDVHKLRTICLNHQVQLYLDEAERAPTREMKEAMLTRLDDVRERLRSLGH